MALQQLTAHMESRQFDHATLLLEYIILPSLKLPKNDHIDSLDKKWEMDELVSLVLGKVLTVTPIVEANKRLTPSIHSLPPDHSTVIALIKVFFQLVALIQSRSAKGSLVPITNPLH